MSLALEEARSCVAHGDVPVGCVISRGDEVIARGGNERELRQDPTAHAEVLVLREAGTKLGGWRIPDSVLYITLEPCSMCAGAIVSAICSERAKYRKNGALPRCESARRISA